jgi:hypothetical protein
MSQKNTQTHWIFLLCALLVSTSAVATPPSKVGQDSIGKKALPAAGTDSSGKPPAIFGIIGSTESQIKKATGELFPNAKDSLSDAIVSTNSISDYFVMPEVEIKKLLNKQEFADYQKWRADNGGKILYFKVIPDSKNRPTLLPVYKKSYPGLASMVVDEESIWQTVLARMKGISQTKFYQSIFQDHSGE